MAVTALASCHRYESANHRQLGRLMEFSLREVIFLGAPEFVRDTREKCLNLIEAFVKIGKLEACCSLKMIHFSLQILRLRPSTKEK